MLYIVSFLILSLSLLINNAAASLFLGVFLAISFNIPEKFYTKKYGSKILQTGIVFLGGSLSIDSFLEINSAYFIYISLFVVTAFVLVLIAGRLLGVSEKLAYLLGSGTAICGGTAIAAVGPAIKAKPEEFTTAIAIIFLLNDTNPFNPDPLVSLIKKFSYKSSKWCAIKIFLKLFFSAYFLMRLYLFSLEIDCMFDFGFFPFHDNILHSISNFFS